MNYIIEIGGKRWVVVVWFARYLGLSDGKIKNLKRLVKNDFFLSQHCMCSNVYTNGGAQKCILLDEKYVIALASKISYQTLTTDNLPLLNDVYEHYLGIKFDSISRNDNSEYMYEFHLRDDLYQTGSINGCKIINKEVLYDFGRVDLLAESSNNILPICIELKKGLAIEKHHEQLLRYKNSGCFSEVYYLASRFSDVEKAWCKLNGITPLTYRRELIVDVA